MIRVTNTNADINSLNEDVLSKKDALTVISNAIILPLYSNNSYSTFENVLCEVFKKAFPDQVSKMSDEVNLLVKNTITSSRSNTTNPWIVTFASSANSVLNSKSKVVIIASFNNIVNLSDFSIPVKVVGVVLYHQNSKKVQRIELTAQTLASLFSDNKFCQCLPSIKEASQLNVMIQSQIESDKAKVKSNRHFGLPCMKSIGSGVKENFLRRLSFYASDFKDGLQDWKTVSKVLSSSLFIFFLCILPCVAFGVLNAKNTEDKLNADRALLGQAVGGLLFAVFAGQPYVIIATTAPLSLCSQIVFAMSQSMEVDFYSLHALVGLFNCFFLVLYGILGCSDIIISKWTSRCVQEIFLMFSFVCFFNDALADAYGMFFQGDQSLTCNMACKLGFLLLLFSTSFTSQLMHDFKFSKFGTSTIRDLVSDYAVPTSVLIFSIIGFYMRSSIQIEYYVLSGTGDLKVASLNVVKDPQVIMMAMLVGFAVSLLFFMDQGISAQLVDSPMHGLKKGNANDYDLIVVGVINVLTSLFGLPFMHGLLPHSPLHVQSLCDWNESYDTRRQVKTRVVVHVRETRLAAILCHLLICFTVLYCPAVFSQIPVAVLNGLFLYCALSCLTDNSFFQRLLLLVTQQSKYPENHYLRTVPQGKVHLFTVIELLLTVILVCIGYSSLPLLKIFFPAIIALLIPIRHLLLTRLIGPKFVKALDSYE